MKRFYKIIISSLAIAIVFFFSVFAVNKYFSSELYIIKDCFSNIFGNNFHKAFVQSENDTVNTEISSLIENGAYLCDSLLLVNSSYPLPDNYTPILIDLDGNKLYSNPDAAKGYIELKNVIKNKYGSSLYIMSSYRTPDEQKDIIESEGEYAAEINESEHLTGLAFDVYVKYYAGMGFLDSDEGKFVNSSCQDYGFIIRYPYYGEKITGIPYEPWHIHYVGKPHAKIIMENKLTLEEYIDSFVPGASYFYEGYYISRQSGNKGFSVPKGISDIVISPDNTGYYFITGKIN